jgi:hypothetical protein
VSLNSTKLDFKQQTSTFTDSTNLAVTSKRIDHEQQKKEAERLLNKKRMAKVQNNVQPVKAKDEKKRDKKANKKH